MFTTSYDVKQSITIKASVATVWKHIATFEQQSQWSPWIIMEPDTPTTLVGTDGVVGSTWSWNGLRIGSGEQTILAIDPHHSFMTSITYFTPWKSHATASFLLEVIDKKTTQVTWLMNSSLPLFAFWMKKTMIKCIQNDYMRGLILLKDLVENGKIQTETIYDGEVQTTSLSGIGITNTSTKKDMSTIMSQNFATLRKYSKKNKLSITGGFTLYTKTNLLKETFEFVGCLTTATSDVSSLPDGIETYSTQAGKYLRVTHRGDYTYIENSRSALYGAAMALKKKNNKKIPSYEKYIIGPEQSKDSSTWVTEIYLPLK